MFEKAHLSEFSHRDTETQSCTRRRRRVAAIGLKEAREAFKHRRFHYVALTTVVVVGLGAVGIFAVERGENKAITTIGDAFWWAIVTTTTVGYGDVSPVTTEGRLIAVALMVLGIGFIGVLTATITSFFLDPVKATEHTSQVEERLARIEEKLDALMAERDQRL
jgi:voltage-gated potassium channel